VLLPRFNQNYHGLLEARYLGFLAPLCAAALGVAVAAIAVRLAGARRWLLVVGVAVWLVVPAVRVLRHDALAQAEAFDNPRLVAMAESARAAARAGDEILVDQNLKAVTWRAGGQPRRAVEYYLTLGGIPFERASASRLNHLVIAGGRRRVLFLAGDTVGLIGAGRLTALDAVPRPGEGAWGMYGAGR
jgi:hypothetical protein